MDISKIENFFNPERLVAICNEELSTLKEQVTINLQTKRTNSGKNVNSMNVPEETTGATADSMASQVESNAGGFTVSFVGRHNIKNIDEGNSPQDAQEEFGSFESFYQNIKQWARDKEARYGLEFKSINAYWAAKKLWEEGSILYRSGGGTEIIKDLLPQTVDNIDKRITEVIDTSIYEMLETTIEL